MADAVNCALTDGSPDNYPVPIYANDQGTLQVNCGVQLTAVEPWDNQTNRPRTEWRSADRLSEP
jgi:hypothetical protein